MKLISPNLKLIILGFLNSCKILNFSTSQNNINLNKSILKKSIGQTPTKNKKIINSKSPLISKIKENISVGKTEKILKSPSKKEIVLPVNKLSFKQYAGPLDISCCVATEPDKLLQKLILTLKKNKIINYNYLKKLQCRKDGIKFLIEVLTLKETKLSYLKMNKTQGSIFEYNQIIAKLLKEVKNINYP